MTRVHLDFTMNTFLSVVILSVSLPTCEYTYDMFCYSAPYCFVLFYVLFMQTKNVAYITLILNIIC